MNDVIIPREFTDKNAFCMGFFQISIPKTLGNKRDERAATAARDRVLVQFR